MPFLFDRVLVQPTTAQIGATLGDAAHAVVGDLPTDYAAFRDRVAATPAGRRQWPESSRARRPVSGLAVAWWTDPVGRKHVRVAGWVGPADRLRHLLGPPKRPAALLVYPEDLYRREGAEAVVAVCRCGAFGAPTEIGWMGRECGPCHDRREAGQAPPGSELPWRSAPPSSVGPTRWLAFLPPGDALLTLDEVRGWFGWPHAVALRRLDLRTGQATDLLRFHRTGTEAALSPDGTRVAVALAENEFGVLDTGSGAALWKAQGRAAAVAFRPDGRAVAALRERRIAVLDTADGRLLSEVPTGHLLLASDAFLWYAGGRALVTGGRGSHLSVWGLGERRELPTPRRAGQGPLDVACSPDGSLLAVAWSDAVDLVAVGAAVAQSALPVKAWAVAFAPDGAKLATVGGDGLLRLWSSDGRPLGGWSWDGQPMTRVTFSPDGHWLATAAADGAVKLWPWADLLRVADKGAR
jgi:hypothetical protein